MLPTATSTLSTTSEGRETRIQALLAQMRPDAEKALRRMAEALVDAPDAQLFGDLELRLRDLGHEVANVAHQAGLGGRKKRGM